MFIWVLLYFGHILDTYGSVREGRQERRCRGQKGQAWIVRSAGYLDWRCVLQRALDGKWRHGILLCSLDNEQLLS